MQVIVDLTSSGHQFRFLFTLAQNTKERYEVNRVNRDCMDFYLQMTSKESCFIDLRQKISYVLREYIRTLSNRQGFEEVLNAVDGAWDLNTWSKKGNDGYW